MKTQFGRPSVLEYSNKGIIQLPKKLVQKPGVLILPGFLSNAKDYNDFASNLKLRGFAVDIVPIQRKDWWPVILGSSYDFYLEKIHESVEQMQQDAKELILVGHSASGWIARIFLGDQRYNGRVWGNKGKIKRLITLGAPHQSLEMYPFSRVQEKRVGEDESLPEDVKNSSLRFANFWYPTGKSIDDVEIVCVCGRAVLGAPVRPTWDLLTNSEERGMQVQMQLAYNSYRTGIGRGDVWGDFVTPVDIATLPDAVNLVLPDIRHFPQNKETWYGSELALQQWEEYLQ